MLALVGALQVWMLVRWTVTTDCIGSWCAEKGGLGSWLIGPVLLVRWTVTSDCIGTWCVENGGLDTWLAGPVLLSAALAVAVTEAIRHARRTGPGAAASRR